MEVDCTRRVSSGEQTPKEPPEELACKLPDGQKLDLATFLELQSALEEELRSQEILRQELSVVKVANQTFASQLKEAESRNVQLEEQIKRLEERIEGMKVMGAPGEFDRIGGTANGKRQLQFPLDLNSGLPDGSQELQLPPEEEEEGGDKDPAIGGGRGDAAPSPPHQWMV